MPVGIEAWITQIPPITRAWLALSVLTSLAVVRTPIIYSLNTPYSPVPPLQQCHVVTALQLYYSPKSAFVNFQVQALGVLEL